MSGLIGPEIGWLWPWVSILSSLPPLCVQALAENEAEGLAKLIYNKKTGEILGVHIFGLHAADLIHEFSNAIATKQTVSDLHFAVHAHPTLSEVRAGSLGRRGDARRGGGRARGEGKSGRVVTAGDARSTRILIPESLLLVAFFPSRTHLGGRRAHQGGGRGDAQGPVQGLRLRGAWGPRLASTFLASRL